MQEFFRDYGMPVLVTVLTALAGWLGAQIKRLYEKYLDDHTKRAVANTCVRAVEQLYHDLGGAEKLEKAKSGVIAMLQEKGITISDLELNLLIESAVSSFNYHFSGEVSK